MPPLDPWVLEELPMSDMTSLHAFSCYRYARPPTIASLLLFLPRVTSHHPVVVSGFVVRAWKDTVRNLRQHLLPLRVTSYPADGIVDVLLSQTPPPPPLLTHPHFLHS